MDKLRAIRVFAAISKHGSLTEASRQLGKSLPTVVRTLSTLEEELGVRLFNRTTRRIALTEEGEIYLGHCSKWLEELDQVEDRLRGERKQPEGIVRVTAPARFGEMAVAPILCDILEANPKLRVHAELTDRNVDLLDEHIDIAVRIGNLEDSSLVARKIGAVSYVFCASPDFIARNGQPIRAEDIVNYPCIHHNAVKLGENWRSGTDGHRISFKTAGHFVSNTTNANVLACLRGIGIGWFFSYQVAQHVREGRLQIVAASETPDTVPISLVYPHSRLLSPRVQYVIEALQKRLRHSLRTTLALPGS